MLDDRIVDVLVERIVNRIEQGNTFILEEIGKTIKKVGTLTATSAFQLQQILKYGGNYDKIVKKIADITALNVADIYEIFEELAKHDYLFAKQFYDFRNIKYVPYDENIALKRQVKSLAQMTARQYVNFSNTLAFTEIVDGKTVYTDLSKMYQKVIDEAVLNVAQGKTTFDSQMKKVIKNLGKSGVRTVEYGSGYSQRLDSAVRMNLKGALRNLHNEIQAEIGKEFGADGVEISVHINPAPDHAEVQGRQFSKREFEKFQNDQDCVDYTGRVFESEHDGKDRRSISEYNCYHYTFDIVLGASKPQYSDEELRKIIDDNEKGFEFDGEHYTNYQGTQLQRQLETAIRKQKDILTIAEASGNDELVQESRANIRQMTKKYKQLSDVSGLPTKMQRLRVVKQ